MLLLLLCAASVLQPVLMQTNPPSSNIRYQTLYIRQDVDHLSLTNQDTFLQRYLLDDRHWNRDSGPIFFYTGGESNINMFCENTGVMFDWAPAFCAMVVCAEHRYYGESLPYGQSSFKDLSHIGYLTVEQALADFVILIDHLRTTIEGATDSPVITFGGSYGGSLASALRIKYPHVALGALASSAPCWQPIAGCDAHKKFVTDVFRQESSNCADNIRRSWAVINSVGATDAGLRELSRAFGVCQTLSAASLKAFLVDLYSDLAMVNYPTPADFTQPLPAWPVKASCVKLLGSGLSDVELIEGVAYVSHLYYNYTGTIQPCMDLQADTSPAFTFQHCSELIVPDCATGVTDMFEPKAWDAEMFVENCQRKFFGVKPRTHWLFDLEFGLNDLSAASNIIFSNGDLDPWSTGGLMSSISDSVVAIVIEGAAHHVDLRPATADDSTALAEAREKEKALISGWLQQYWYRKKNTPPMDIGGLRGADLGSSARLESSEKEARSEVLESSGRGSSVSISVIVLAVLACTSLVVLAAVLYKKRRTRYETLLPNEADTSESRVRGNTNKTYSTIRGAEL